MRLNKKLAAIAITATVAVVGTAAFAYWTTGGSGTGSASSAAGFPADTVIVNQAAVTDAAMYPGGPTQALSGDFTNENTGGVYVTSLSAVVAESDGGAWTDGECSALDFEISTLDVSVNEIGADSTGGAWSGTIRMIDRPGVDQDDCKLATPAILYTAS